MIDLVGCGSLLVFPAYAGVILLFVRSNKLFFCLSRVCGGDPGIDDIYLPMKMSFPRMRG